MNPTVLSKCEPNVDYGKKLSFWQMLNDSLIEIPTIQRDYTYGAGTDKTNQVLDHLLSDIHAAIASYPKHELILDYVYGNRSKVGAYQPLDGQQRLTTLFLMHLYAFYSQDEYSRRDDDKRVLRRFTYANRASSKEFCAELLSKMDVIDVSCQSENWISAQIADQGYFLPSYSDDPTISSMLNVLDRIHSKFFAIRERLWNVLVASDCPIVFHWLDFGCYDLADDLYLKMNARGKTLTDFEIFKSQFEKFLDTASFWGNDKNARKIKDEASRKFDTSWADLVWAEFGRSDDDVKRIDGGFLCLMQNLFAIVGGLHSAECYDLVLKSAKLTDVFEVIKNEKDVKLLVNMLDVFADAREATSCMGNLCKTLFYSEQEPAPVRPEEKRIRLFALTANPFKDALTQRLPIGGLVFLYGFYLWLKSKCRDDTLLRHLRNLIANSSSGELRKENLHDILTETEQIIGGRIQSVIDTKFNTRQMEEEQRKSRNVATWQSVYRYENHSHLRGALSLFEQRASSESSSQVLAYNKNALKGFSHVFGEAGSDVDFAFDDYETRRRLMAIADFSQRPSNYFSKTKRIVGCAPSHWRELLVETRSRLDQDKIILAFEAIGRNPTLWGDFTQLQMTDWRYYFVRYHEATYVGTGCDHGYYYLEDSKRPLELLRMNSTQHSDYESRLLNRILAFEIWRLQAEGGLGEFKCYFDGMKGGPVSVGDDELTLSVVQDGWKFLKGEDLVRSCGYEVNDSIFVVGEYDYIECALAIIKDVVARRLNSPVKY